MEIMPDFTHGTRQRVSAYDALLDGAIRRLTAADFGGRTRDKFVASLRSRAQSRGYSLRVDKLDETTIEIRATLKEPGAVA